MKTRGQSQLFWSVHHCQWQSAKELLKAVQAIKPTQCKISASQAQDKIVFSCKNQQDLFHVKELFEAIDTSRDLLRIKVHWVVLQESCAFDLLKIFQQDDLNLKSAWKILLTHFIERGSALSLASPEVHALSGSSFEIQTHEIFKSLEKEKGHESKSRKKLQSKLGLSLKGHLQTLQDGNFLVNLDLRHQSECPSESQEPAHTQTLKTQIALRKKALCCLGEIYQLQAFERETNDIITRTIRLFSKKKSPLKKEQKYVSMVFLELL